jgi:hypothetical protein
LIGTPVLSQNELTVARDGLEFSISPEGSSLEEVGRFVAMLDGSNSVRDIVGSMPAAERRRFLSIVSELDSIYLLDDAGATTSAPNGEELFQRVRSIAESKAAEIFANNVAWRQLAKPSPGRPDSVVLGLAIETYYLWYQTAPLAVPPSYASNPRISRLVRGFFARIANDERTIVEVLQSAGIPAKDLEEGIPLASTAALGLAVSYWSHTDPAVFFAIVDALGRCLPSSAGVVRALRAHGLSVEIEPRPDSESIAEAIFHEVQGIGPTDWDRVRSHLELFFEMYDQYFTSIWNHYSTTSRLVRRVLEI